MGHCETPAEQERLMGIFRALLEHFGPRHWWPARTKFEVIVGAILTQSVAWRNVETAIRRLEEAGALESAALRRLPQEELEEMIRPTRYYRAKAKKLKAFVEFLHQRYNDSLEHLFSRPLSDVRSELLGVYGLGPETADSILLYAGGYPVFVVDAYTRRIFHRLGFWPEKIAYREMQEFFHNRLPADPELFNEFHALIVGLGHHFCRETPRCGGCPLFGIHCPGGRGGNEA